MASVKDGSSMSPPMIPAAWHPFRSADTVDIESDLIQSDSYTDDMYEDLGFDPQTSTDIINRTSARVLKPVFNEYAHDDSKPKVIGYYTDWSQYDGRLDGYSEPIYAGRGYDLAKVDPLAYDEIILGFLGICGDTGVNSGAISKACGQMGYGDDKVTFIDLWADIAAWRNNNFTQKEWTDGEGYNICNPEDFSPPNDDCLGYETFMHQEKIENGEAFGVLGGLYKLQQEADASGHELELAFSIGGWSMSGIFSDIAADPSRRQTLIASIADVFERFPMFTQVDIDWEYPGDTGIGNNSYSEQDGENYTLLIGELREYLDGHGMSNKKINIAASAVPEKLEKSNIADLFAAGLDGINVMTYDFFGGNWAPTLAHHTNLSEYPLPLAPEEKYINSVHKAVEYLKDEGIDMSKVYIGYAGYTRNAVGVEIMNPSPLEGFMSPPSGDAKGTFESLSSEYNDVLYNYFDPENRSGKNGYVLYTDEIANADYLYSEDTNVFISLDTPRSVYAKGKYAALEGLGGIFTWTIDQDAGLLVNAAREGAGYVPSRTEIDMADFYFCGGNINPAICQTITDLPTMRKSALDPHSSRSVSSYSKDPNKDMKPTTIKIKTAGPVNIDIEQVSAP